MQQLTYYELDYEADRRKHEVSIADEDPNRYVVHGPPVVTYPGFLTFALNSDLGSEVVDQVDATFDFSKMPSHRHIDALNWLL